MATTQLESVIREMLAGIIAEEVVKALANNAPNPDETRKDSVQQPRQTANANRMVCKWATIEDLEVVTLQRHKLNRELMDSSRVKRMIANEVKDCRKQGVKPTKILVDGTWAFVKLPKTVTREQAQFDMHAIENWGYSKKEHAFYRDFS